MKMRNACCLKMMKLLKKLSKMIQRPPTISRMFMAVNPLRV